MINGWTSGNSEVDKFISSTIYKAGLESTSAFIEWVPFNRFANIELIGEGGFAKVYSATWIDGKSEYEKLNDENWKKLNFVPTKVVLKRLNESQNISVKCLNEVYFILSFYYYIQ
jgi:hypothetical protein